MAVIELDRVFGESPEALEQYWIVLKATRQTRLNTIANSTARILSRMNAVIDTANTKVLLHPMAVHTVTDSSAHVIANVSQFNSAVGIEGDSDTNKEKHWLEAAVKVRDMVVETSAQGAVRAKRVGGESLVTILGNSASADSGTAERLQNAQTKLPTVMRKELEEKSVPESVLEPAAGPELMPAQEMESIADPDDSKETAQS
ncbi:hypothetical protein WM016_08465 [Bifidobacterium mongoliense]|uniref:hypothetical protein n=1 Tax=Bifidobacterium mongoliense TaxID=518643 RepID=UPI0030EEE1D2